MFYYELLAWKPKVSIIKGVCVNFLWQRSELLLWCRFFWGARFKKSSITLLT